MLTVPSRSTLSRLLGTVRPSTLAGLLVEIGLVAAYILLRSVEAPRALDTAWLALACAVALLRPTTGLVVFVAVAPFSEPFTITRELGAKPLLLGASALGLVGRSVLGWVAAWARRSRPSLPVLDPPSAAALAVLLVTAGGLLATTVRFGASFAGQAAGFWLAGVGVAVVTFLATSAVARSSGAMRIAIVAVASAALAGLVGLVDWAGLLSLREGPVAWMLRPAAADPRLTGVTRAPNATGALLLVPVVALGVAAAGRHRLAIRSAALILLLPLVVALAATFSRSALLGLAVGTIVIAWRLRPTFVRPLLIVLAAVALLVPAYITLRGDIMGPGGQPGPGGLIQADAQRLDAWSAAIRAWLAAPLTGHGFWSFRILHEGFGLHQAHAPHNEWLRLLAEEGALGGAAALAFVWVATASLSASARTWATVGLAVLAAWTVAASFNNPLSYLQVNAGVFAVVGTAVGLALRSPVTEVPVTAAASPAMARAPALGAASRSAHVSREG